MVYQHQFQDAHKNKNKLIVTLNVKTCSSLINFIYLFIFLLYYAVAACGMVYRST